LEITATRSPPSLKISHQLAFLLYADQLIREGSEVGVILVVPPVETEAEGKLWCFGKVVRVEKELKEGKFGIVIGFQRRQVLSQA
jgi:hypothetical protein